MLTDDRHSRLRIMVFSTTFKYISVISWRSVVLGEETPDLSQVTDKLDHIMLHQEHLNIENICDSFVMVVWKLGFIYQSNKCLSPVTLSVRITIIQGVLDATLCDQVCQ
jgi:hypothetical protein